ncbi:T9SS type B sorting domain-containing protein [Chitinophaga agrisoli]|uniref:T9SS type B sorting domain-containing protein n=1 Tax=Chitinophaga agrisoli TaxID=2607653 RepID=A0A5B2VJ89_9BACT|nr:gliding motility-associated C-terminal domain-containing protein [Chitinophaga agrisoli]KAA2238412.1 T9SS type B sorting domain-containing protein [Chitinophaga agrisoli]
MFAKLKRIGWLLGLLLCNILKAQLPLPVLGPCGASATISGVVNTYYPGLNNINTGEVTIVLGAPTGNAQPLVRGDRVLIIQMQDATINSSNTPAYGGNGTGGNGCIDPGLSGQFEFGRVANIAGNIITLSNPLQRSYRAISGIPNRKSAYQVVRVPTYQNATLAGNVTATGWNGAAGGIVAFHAWQILDLNGHEISATGLGFRPGKINSAGGLYNLQDYVSLTYGSYGEKGEGIAGTPLGTWAATAGGYENGSFGRGAPANAGGGGNAHNSGGGGGANYGDGGQGGYQYSGPQDVGGRGGKGITTGLPGRIIMGGGGGGGHQNNAAAFGGELGGGIILITANQIMGTGLIHADGNSAGPSTDDGAGGGGAGGTVMLSYTGTLPAGITITAKGGAGGNETFLARHGSGGGAGGGVIITSTPVAITDVSGGLRGLSNGTEYGATDGTPGITMDLDLSQLHPDNIVLPLLEVKDTVVCAPAAVDLISTVTNSDQGPEFVLSYWTNPAATDPLPTPHAVSQPGIYYIKLTNTNTNCQTVRQLEVTVHPQPILVLTATSPPCAGGNGSIVPRPGNGTAPYEFSTDGGMNWQTTGFNSLPAGTYTMLVRDSYGCISRPVSATLTEPPLLTLGEETGAHADVTCQGLQNGQLQLNATGGTTGYLYTVSSAATGVLSNNTGLFTGLGAGAYNTGVTDAAGCTQSGNALILEPPALQVSLISKTDLECDALPKAVITLSATGGVPPYAFSTGNNSWQSDSIFRGLALGPYTIVVRDGNNCVTDPLQTEIIIVEDCDIFFPSAFTPNGDGRNDLFRPKYYKRVSHYQLNVYNRWGATIFQSNDPAIGWDGSFKGALSDTGTFVWIATFMNRHGQAQTVKGTVTLVR